MPIQDCDFWCIHYDCSSYHSGDFCHTCSLFMQCSDCCLQSKDPRIPCEDLAYYITHGFPEVEE